jgi:hypothetical protein
VTKFKTVFIYVPVVEETICIVVSALNVVVATAASFSGG